MPIATLVGTEGPFFEGSAVTDLGFTITGLVRADIVYDYVFLPGTATFDDFTATPRAELLAWTDRETLPEAVHVPIPFRLAADARTEGDEWFTIQIRLIGAEFADGKTVALVPVAIRDLAPGDGSESMIGNDGDETVHLRAGADRFAAGAGNDRVTGGQGADTIEGQAGSDKLLGGRGHDMLSGGPGNDLLDGGRGRDTLDGGRGRDNLFGDGGNDLLAGGRHADRLVGGAGSDTLRGGPGDDDLSGGSGGDRLFAGDGADTLSGGGGDDTLAAGQGRTTLTGGDGADTFRFGAGLEKAVVQDFDPAAGDRIAFASGSGGPESLAAFRAALVPTSGGVAYSSTDDRIGTIIFAGLDPDDLTGDNWM